MIKIRIQAVILTVRRDIIGGVYNPRATTSIKMGSKRGDAGEARGEFGAERHVFHDLNFCTVGFN